MVFTQNQPVAFEDSLTCEIRPQPVQAIRRVVDEYVVSLLPAAACSIHVRPGIAVSA
jgi:hypothetical protein